MRRVLPALVLALALLASSLADARPGGAGHNPPTRKLEAAFKVALHQRSVSEDGCYASPKALARQIADWTPMRTGVTRSPGSVGQRGIVFVIRQGSNCNKVRMALRHSTGLYVLDSAKGTIRVLGRRGAKSDPGQPGPPAA